MKIVETVTIFFRNKWKLWYLGIQFHCVTVQINVKIEIIFVIREYQGFIPWNLLIPEGMDGRSWLLYELNKQFIQ